MAAERLAAETRDLWRACEPIADPSDALTRASALAGPRDLVCVTGSIFLLDDLSRAGLIHLRSLEL